MELWKCKSEQNPQIPGGWIRLEYPRSKQQIEPGAAGKNSAPQARFLLDRGSTRSGTPLSLSPEIPFIATVLVRAIVGIVVGAAPRLIKDAKPTLRRAGQM